MREAVSKLWGESVRKCGTAACSASGPHAVKQEVHTSQSCLATGTSKQVRNWTDDVEWRAQRLCLNFISYRKNMNASSSHSMKL